MIHIFNKSIKCGFTYSHHKFAALTIGTTGVPQGLSSSLDITPSFSNLLYSSVTFSLNAKATLLGFTNCSAYALAKNVATTKAI